MSVQRRYVYETRRHTRVFSMFLARFLTAPKPRCKHEVSFHSPLATPACSIEPPRKLRRSRTSKSSILAKEMTQLRDLFTGTSGRAQ